MAVKDVQIKVRNATNDAWDDINPKTKASLVNLASVNFTAENVEGGMDELFTSVSSGKTQIASAITGMGQTAAGSDTFAVLSGKISDISNDATAIASDVLTTKTFYAGGVKQTGNMANHGSVTYTPTDSTQTGSAGYYSDITVNPRPTLTGNATTAQVLSGRLFYGSTYTQQTGTIPSKGAQTYTPGTTNQSISAGQYLSGTQTISGSANLLAGNIRSGVNIFGVVGNVQQASGPVLGTIPTIASSGTLSSTSNNTWTKLKEFTASLSGTHVFAVTLRSSVDYTIQIEIRKNGSLLTSTTERTTTYITVNYTYTIVAGDVISFWFQRGLQTNTIYVSNFVVSGSYTTPPPGTITFG